MKSLPTQREYDRWYKLKDTPKQRALVDDARRFKVVPAGRRSGKTERFKRYVVKECMNHSNEMYFSAAPTHSQAKRIFWNDLKLLSLSSTHDKRPSESELIIYFNNGTTLTVLGLDKPERFEGIPWTGGGIDEIANIKPNAWEENISPALDTVSPARPDYRPWCWLFGVPDGLGHYYDLAHYADTSNDPEWSLYHWKSSDILPPDVIEAAKRKLSPRQFRQEYEASFETAAGRIYDDYNKANHTDEQIMPHEQLMWHHDFNYTPLSSAIAVRRDKGIFILDEIILTSAVSEQSAKEFCDKFKDHQNKHVLIYGDPAGKAGEKHGHQSDYTQIEAEIRRNGWTFTRKVKQAAPAIKDRQNAVRAKVLNANGERTLFVNPNKCVYTNRGLSTVQLKKGSTFQEEDGEYQHITTAVGYMIDYEYPVGNKSTQTTIYT